MPYFDDDVPYLRTQTVGVLDRVWVSQRLPFETLTPLFAKRLADMDRQAHALTKWPNAEACVQCTLLGSGRASVSHQAERADVGSACVVVSICVCPQRQRGATRTEADYR